MTIERRSLLCLVALLACADDPPPVQTGPPPAVVSTADLSALRWIAGAWRAESTAGTEPLFYERYTFVDDSTLLVQSFADAAMGAPESTYFELRGGRFGNRSRNMRFAAEKITPTSVTFMPIAGAKNHFTWEYYSNDVWTAKLSAPAEGGQPARELTYHMQRVR
jgi:hypothetical protein